MAIFDNFNRADNNSLGSGWTESESSADGISIVSNRVSVGKGSGARGVACRSEKFYTHQSASLTLYTPAGTDASPCGGPAVRIHGTYSNLYSYHAAIGTTKVFLRKHVNQALATSGSGSLLGTYTKGSSLAGDTIKIEANGSTIKIYVNGVEQISVVDTSSTSGSPGMLGNGYTTLWTSFIATGEYAGGLLTFVW